MLAEQLRKITNKKLNIDLNEEFSQLKATCKDLCVKAAKKGESSQQFTIINSKPELDEAFEAWMLEEGLGFWKNDATGVFDEIIYNIFWRK